MRQHYTKSLLALVVVLGLGTAIYYNRYFIYDELRLFNYSPPSEVASLASQDTMTPYAKTLFYAYHPQIENSASFNENCKVSTQAIVLGCTVIGQGIYLYNVNDSQLNGIEQATAAYEMLHVAYSRLSTNERNYINGLVQSTYNQAAASDPIIKAEVASYYETEGAAAVPNELHSVVGTEIENLPPALEKYYSQYFTDRQAIVDFTNQYENVFSQRQQAINADDQELTTWKQEIELDESKLTSDTQQIDQIQTTLNAYKSTDNINGYTNEAEDYENVAASYNALLSETKSLIGQYNQLVVSRNSIAVSEDQLIQSVSSLPVSESTN